jgi:D-lactate dehydrogenase
MSEIALFVDLDRQWARRLLEQELSGLDLELAFFNEPLDEATERLGPRCGAVRVLSPFISSAVTGAAMEKLPALELIATRSTGFDHVDLDVARARGVTVCNVPGYGDNTVAEHTFALILSLSRKLRETYERVRRDAFNLVDLEGFELRGKTLGVIGTGHIGLRVIQIARGFSMRVAAYDPREQSLLADVLGFTYCSLEDLLASADIVSLHAPLSPQTHHLMDASTLARMKQGALLINTARGGLVDTDALLEALRSGHLAGAGLDVLEHESMLLDEDQARAGLHDTESMRATVLNHLLLGRDNVIFTPHLAFNSREANERIFRTTADNIRSFFAGVQCRNVVVGS